MSTSSLMPIPVADILQSASGTTAANPTAGMAREFAQAMQASPMNVGVEEAASSTVVKAILAQDHVSHELSSRMQGMAEAHRSGDDTALDAANRVSMFHDLANASFQFNACVNLAQGAKNGMQTLMKNQ